MQERAAFWVGYGGGNENDWRQLKKTIDKAML